MLVDHRRLAVRVLGAREGQQATVQVEDPAGALPVPVDQSGLLAVPQVVGLGNSLAKRVDHLDRVDAERVEGEGHVPPRA